MPIKSVKMKISKNKKLCFFLMSEGLLNPKIKFLGQKVCSVAESDYCGHSFRVSGVFPSTYHHRPKNYANNFSAEPFATYYKYTGQGTFGPIL